MQKYFRVISQIGGPTVDIPPSPFKELYNEWVQVSPEVDALFRENHVCWPEKIGQVYFFFEFSIPWIHKWTPEFEYTEEQIPCLYRVYYNNFWDKLLKKDPSTGQLYGQSLIDLISQTIRTYKSRTKTIFVEDNSIKYMTRKINFQEGDKEEYIAGYLDQIRQNLMETIEQIADKSDVSMKSNSSQVNDNDDYLSFIQELNDSQEPESHDPEITVNQAEEFLRNLSKKEGKKSME